MKNPSVGRAWTRPSEPMHMCMYEDSLCVAPCEGREWKKFVQGFLHSRHHVPSMGLIDFCSDILVSLDPTCWSCAF